MDVDVVVIGSGAGGLTAGLALARAGMKVVVLEQHYLPGGWCHSFHLGGYRFSPGVHYIGELQPGGRMRRVYEGLGVGRDLDFFELNPDGYDHVLLGGGRAVERYDIPKGRDEMARRLGDRFPSERRGIEGYLGAVQRISDQLEEMSGRTRLRDAITMPLRAPTVMRWALSSARSLMRNYVRDPRLEAVLGAQAGDHGLPPSLAPAPLHAAVAAHYFDGGYYPRGGGGAIPRAFIRALRRAGGDIRVRASVEKILVENGRAIGVRLKGGEEIRAKHVVSNADPHVTFGKLVGAEHLSAKLRDRLARTRYGVSAISVFMAAKIDPRALGLDSGNYWLYPDGDVDRTYRAGMAPWVHDTHARIPGLFLTVTSLKDPTKKLPRGVHTMEAFTFVAWEDFARWAHTKYGERSEDYARMKRELQERMLGSLETIVPGLRRNLEFVELGTPLTNVHYVAATNGNLYGTEKTMKNLGPFAYQLGTEIGGLYLCGASTISHGVMGATMSGLFAAAKILKCDARSLLTPGGESVGLYRTDDPSSWPDAWRTASDDVQQEAALAP